MLVSESRFPNHAWRFPNHRFGFGKKKNATRIVLFDIALRRSPVSSLVLFLPQIPPGGRRSLTNSGAAKKGVWCGSVDHTKRPRFNQVHRYTSCSLFGGRSICSICMSLGAMTRHSSSRKPAPPKCTQNTAVLVLPEFNKRILELCKKKWLHNMLSLRAKNAVPIPRLGL